jgi:hypothetical protein
MSAITREGAVKVATTRCIWLSAGAAGRGFGDNVAEVLIVVLQIV